jgi:hypothetical protein
MKYRSKTNIRKIRSLKDLHSEKLRLKEELLRSEEGIVSNYHQIREALSFRNILKTVTDDVAVASTAFSKAFSFGKTLLRKVKKKKKKGKQTETEIKDQNSQHPDN